MFKCTGKAYFEAVTFIIHIKNLTHVKGGQVTLSYVHAIVQFFIRSNEDMYKYKDKECMEDEIFYIYHV